MYTRPPLSTKRRVVFAHPDRYKPVGAKQNGTNNTACDSLSALPSRRWALPSRRCKLRDSSGSWPTSDTQAPRTHARAHRHRHTLHVIQPDGQYAPSPHCSLSIHLQCYFRHVHSNHSAAANNKYQISIYASVEK